MNFFSNFFEKFLEDYGFTDTTVNFSIGDRNTYMEFSGSISHENAFLLLASSEKNYLQRVKTLMGFGEFEECRDICALDDTISFNNNRVVIEEPDFYFGKKVDGQQLEAYKELWNSFLYKLDGVVLELSEKLIELASKFKRSHYGFDDAEIVYQRNTENFCVQIERTPSDLDYIDDDLFNWDKSLFEKFVNNVIAGTEKISDYKAEVSLSVGGSTVVVGSDAVSEVFHHPDDKTLSHYKREIVGEAIRQAREALSNIKIKAA